MEDTPRDQQNKIDSKKSTGSQYGGPSSCTSTYISFGNNSSDKNLIKYNIVESLYIKEETVQDEEVHQQGKNSLLSGKSQLEEKCITTLPSDNNSGVKTLIEYDIEESLDIKEEIIQDEERHQWETHNLLSGRIQLHEKCITTEISCDNNSACNTLIKYEYDEALEIKEEIIQDQENIDQKLNTKYDSKLCTLDTKEADIKIPWNSKTEKIQESKSEPKKKYNCEKCARNYAQKRSLNTHKKFECDVIPQFNCEFCGKHFKLKDQQTKTESSQSTGSQDGGSSSCCTTTLISSSNNSITKTLIEYDIDETLEIKEEFIQDTREADIMTVTKARISKKKNQESQQEPENIYKCEKCARSYVWKAALYNHKRFECDVKPQFSCEFCSKPFKLKGNMNKHILRVHQKTDSKASQTRYNCGKCSRSYSSTENLRRHKCLEHAAVRLKFICDFCGFQAKRKGDLSQHITSKHLKL